MKIREYFVSVKTQLEEYNEALKAQLSEAKTEIAERTSEIGTLKAEGGRRVEEIARLELERSNLESTSRELTKRLGALQGDASRHFLLLQYKKAPESLQDIHNSWR